jgi:hypothetical protein
MDGRTTLVVLWGGGLVVFPARTVTALFAGMAMLLDEHENSNKENPRNREPGCIYTIEY